MMSRTSTPTSTSPKRSWPPFDAIRLGRAVIIGVLLAAMGRAPVHAIECGETVYRVTVTDPTGRSRATRVCALGELAFWLHLTPESSIVGFPVEEDLGPLYIVQLAALEADGVRPLLQLRLYPGAPGSPRVFLAEPGYIETQGYTGSVSSGWRVLAPAIRVPATLVAVGVPHEALTSPSPDGDRTSSAPGGGRGPDAVSLVVLGLLVTGAVGALRRRRGVLARGQPDP